MQVTCLPGTGAAAVCRLLPCWSAAVHLDLVSVAAAAVAVATAAAIVRRPVGGRGGGGVLSGSECRLLADFLEDLFEEAGEVVCVAGAEEGKGAGLDLGGPVVGLCVERVEELFLDSRKAERIAVSRRSCDMVFSRGAFGFLLIGLCGGKTGTGLHPRRKGQRGG